MLEEIKNFIMPGRGLNLTLFLWLWSYSAFIIVLAYESLALDMTILPVLEPTADNFKDFADKNITLITDHYKMGMDYHMKSQENKYERKQGYEALELGHDTYEIYYDMLINFVHKRGSHAFIFQGKHWIQRNNNHLGLLI